jgi:predicted enzyme related to lactoylglutathione lyase
MAFFPVSSGIGGAVIAAPDSIPSDTGPLIYLNGGNDLNDVLNKVKAGGRVVMQKLSLVMTKVLCHFIDSQETN